VGEDGTSAIRFSGTGEELTYAVVGDGQLRTVAPIVACGADFVEICSFGRRHRIELSPSEAGNELEIHHRTTDSRRAYHRAGHRAGDEETELVAAFEPSALDLPEVGALPEERAAAIRRELAERGERDQAVRQQPIDQEEMMRVDSDNTAWLKGVVGEVGWIDPERFGPEAADAAFLIVQHSGDLPLMMAALPHLEAQERLSEYALMYDRLQLRLGGEQRYGSQIGWSEDGTKGLLPIESLDDIDARRREMGLGSLDEYLALFELEERRVLDCR
jgi:hypothetical protein